MRIEYPQGQKKAGFRGPFARNWQNLCTINTTMVPKMNFDTELHEKAPF